MIWCFLDGVFNRKLDFPVGSKADYTKYRVALSEEGHELIFFKSNKSDRWWLEVPYPTSEKRRFERHHMVPCSYEDYEEAMRDEMPEKWLHTFNKLG